MPIKLEIVQETPNEVVNAILSFAGQFKGMGAVVPEPVTAPQNEIPSGAVEVQEPKRPGRKKAPAADTVIDQNQADIEEVTGKTPQPANDVPMLTIDDAREHMKRLAKDGHMDAVEKALDAFGVKKVSDVDPDAGGKPSPKFAAFVAKIEEFIPPKSA